MQRQPASQSLVRIIDPARHENYNNDHSLRHSPGAGADSGGGGGGGINTDSSRAIRASPWERENWDPGEPTAENNPLVEVEVGWQWSEIR